jgi:S1-C subfamily serine protease
MFGRIAAAAVLVCLVAACVMVTAPAFAGDKETTKVVITSGDDGAGWLGVGIQELTRKLRDKLDIDDDIKGVLVTEVYDDSPAEDAGIKDHDVIISIDGKRSEDVSDLVDLVKSREPGTDVTVTVYRKGSELELKATLAEREDTFIWRGGDELYDLQILKSLEGLEALKGLEELKGLEHLIIPEISLGLSGWGRRGKLGVYVEDVSGELGKYFEIPGGEGVLVEGVVEDSPAEKAGIKAGDIIYKIDGKALCCTEELVKAIGKMKPDVETPIVLIRKGDQKTVNAVVGESDYDKSLKEYKITIDELGDADYLLQAIEEEKDLTDEEREEIREAVEELQEELQELRKELEEMRKDID